MDKFGKSIVWRGWAVAVPMLCALALGVAATAAKSAPDLRGTWSCCGSGGAGAQTWKITSMSGDSFSGSGGGGAYTFPIKGTVSGRSVTLTTGPYTQLPSYSATFKGKLSSNGKLMSGTWTSNEHQAGTWTATLSGSVSKPKPKPKPKPKCKVPSVKGRTLAQAKAALGAAHCAAGKVSDAYSSSTAKGKVISQSKKPGASLANRTKINLKVSKGKKPSKHH